MKGLVRSFGYALRGLYHAVRSERNLRIHVVVMVYLYGFLLVPDWFVVTSTQWALLLLASALVVATELVNTAIEAVVDLVTRHRHHPLAAVAKDTAAAGVLVCALFAVGVGVAVLWQPAAFARMGAFFAAHPVMAGALAVSAAVAGALIFAVRPQSEPTQPRPDASPVVAANSRRDHDRAIRSHR